MLLFIGLSYFFLGRLGFHFRPMQPYRRGNPNYTGTNIQRDFINLSVYICCTSYIISKKKKEKKNKRVGKFEYGPGERAQTV